MRILCAAIVALGVCAEVRADDSATPRHLLLGVRAFKDGRYDEALVELRLVARAPDAPADLAFYLGPTLYKLQRYDEALTTFVSSRAAPDALTDFYLGQTYYQLGLYRKARAVFAGLRARGLGPALDAAAGRYVDAVDLVYRTAPAAGSIDAYLAQGLELAGKAPVLAGEYLDEANQVEALAVARHRHVEIVTALAAAWNAIGRAREVAALLTGEQRRSVELSWELARAYVALGDAGRARPLLDAIIDAHGAHEHDAAAAIARLPP
jgi:tetratricopeptide (TPR) repeat protein